MRVDVVSVFPEYLDPLRLSLTGRAKKTGLLDLRVHDLRDWTHDRHRTVDDTPYGGGAGMVMKPEPWGEAIDAVIASGGGDAGRSSSGHPLARSSLAAITRSQALGRPSGAATAEPILVVPTPAGEPFTQERAAELAQRPWLLFACGRYEGIDQRVIDDARTRMDVLEVSLGDYVLNGGEVAALAIIEAVVRLVPGFVGNPDSLDEESHGRDGLLEYPVYTKPPTWRGLEVPPVLLSGDHRAIEAWRNAAAVRRTAERRPDLVHPSVLPDGELRLVHPADAGELLTLQRACWVQEQQSNPDVGIDALTETLDDVREWIRDGSTLVLVRGGRLVAAVRGRLHGSTWDIGRLMVAPDLQGQGIGRQLLAEIEAAAPDGATEFELFTGAGSLRNQRMYKRAGYRSRGLVRPGVLRLTKTR